MHVLCFGSLNLDLVYTVEHIATPGETIAAKERKIFPGGKGLNQSVAMARAGLSVCHAGIVGADGKLLLDTLCQSGVNTDYVRQDGKTTGHAMIQVEEGAGQNTIVLYGGGNREMTPEFVEAVLSHFEKGDWIVLQNEVNRLDEIIQKASAKGMHIVLNPSPFDAAVTASISGVFVSHQRSGRRTDFRSKPAGRDFKLDGKSLSRSRCSADIGKGRRMVFSEWKTNLSTGIFCAGRGYHRCRRYLYRLFSA